MDMTLVWVLEKKCFFSDSYNIKFIFAIISFQIILM